MDLKPFLPTNKEISKTSYQVSGNTRQYFTQAMSKHLLQPTAEEGKWYITSSSF
jgi:hypothetical protein